MWIFMAVPIPEKARGDQFLLWFGESTVGDSLFNICNIDTIIFIILYIDLVLPCTVEVSSLLAGQ